MKFVIGSLLLALVMALNLALFFVLLPFILVKLLALFGLTITMLQGMGIVLGLYLLRRLMK